MNEHISEVQQLIDLALECGFSHAGGVDVATLKSLEAVREMCAVDKCHAYERTWTCPPGCGTIPECQEKLRRYEFGVLVQTTAELEDTMDYEGMMEGAEKQKASCEAFRPRVQALYPDVLALTMASCDICRKCTYPDAPCRFPERATAAMEGYGLLVSQVCRDNGILYYYGPNTVTYTGMFLVRPGDKE